MDNKKFLSYMSIGLGFFMVLAIFYIISATSKKEVTDYRLDDGLYYTGAINKNKLEGKASLKSTDGNFTGAFNNGRFDGPGLFKAEDFAYMATFDRKKGNSNTTIFLEDGTTYRKIDGKWKEIGGIDED